MTLGRQAGCRSGLRAAWLSAASAVATAGLLALAVGTPVALASSGTPTAARIVASDGASSGIVVGAASNGPVDPAASVTDVPAPVASDTSTPTILPSASDTASATTTPDPTATSTTSASPSASASASAPAVAELSPASQSVVGVAGRPLDGTASLASSGLTLPVTYTVSPRLPSGLSLSASTGSIGGTPLTAQKAADYTITGTEASDAGSSAGTKAAVAEAVVTIAVRADITPTKQTLNLSTGTEMRPSTELVPVGFPDSVTYAIQPALPTPLAMDPTTGVITGTPARALTTTAFEVTGTSTGSAGSFSATTTIEVTIGCGNPASTPPECTPPPLALGGADPSALMSAAVSAAADADPIHGPYSMQTDTCARCHRLHTAAAPVRLQRGGSDQSELCMSCHNGTGAPAGSVPAEYPNNPDSGTRVPNVQEEYAAAGNTPGFSHNVPASVGNAHAPYESTDGGEPTPNNEFIKTATANRHAECTDCHNPHNSAANPVSNPVVISGADTGWSASGRIIGAAGVAVSNHGAGTTPDFSFLNGNTTQNQMTREYQLCFKCHSGFTNLDGRRDVAVEFNPANPSYHPIEAAGTNQTAAMGKSLAGNSYSKVWNFATETSTGSGVWKSDQTVRCVHCHAYQTIDVKDGSGATLRTVPSDPHAAPASAPDRKNILLNNYNESTDLVTYSEPNYALCFTCHSNDPFPGVGNKDNPSAIHARSASTATNFKRHSLHASGQVGCPQCHYDSHSTTTGATDIGLIHGVKLAPSPDIVPDAGTTGITFNKAWTGTDYLYTVTCTLTCHGVRHDGDPNNLFQYSYHDPN